jgi:hypothetical protein
VYREDGSLTITVQHEQPQNEAEKANWLPAPEGPFYLVMRIYWPEQTALDGSWTPPPGAQDLDEASPGHFDALLTRLNAIPDGPTFSPTQWGIYPDAT